MNKNTIRWAYHPLNPIMAEAFQRIAFTFGYKWPTGDGTNAQDVRFTTATFLVVDPDRKELTYTNSPNLENSVPGVKKVIFDLGSVLEQFTNPPMEVVRLGSQIQIFKDGSVQITGGKISSSVVEQMIEERKKLTGVKEPNRKLPLVQFLYTSQNQGRKIRNVLVVEYENGYLRGLDKDDDYKFKLYKLEKITGSVTFNGFETEPS
jgi:hypothetical protein